MKTLKDISGNFCCIQKSTCTTVMSHKGMEHLFSGDFRLSVRLKKHFHGQRFEYDDVLTAPAGGLVRGPRC